MAMLYTIATEDGSYEETNDWPRACDLWAEFERQGSPAMIIHVVARAIVDETAVACLRKLSWYRTHAEVADTPDWLLNAMDRIGNED